MCIYYISLYTSENTRINAERRGMIKTKEILIDEEDNVHAVDVDRQRASKSSGTK